MCLEQIAIRYIYTKKLYYIFFFLKFTLFIDYKSIKKTTIAKWKNHKNDGV